MSLCLFVYSAMPQFSELSKMMKAQKIMKPLNSSVRLKCKASGHPRPEIVWEKDGTRMVITEGRQSRQFTLKLSHLKPGDSGTYMCIVFNKHGRINATYEVDVVGEWQMVADCYCFVTSIDVRFMKGVGESLICFSFGNRNRKGKMLLQYYEINQSHKQIRHILCIKLSDLYNHSKINVFHI